MSYKYLDYERDKELINVLCGDYDLKATLEFIDDMCNDAYAYGFAVGKDDGWCECYETYQETIEDDYEYDYNCD